ncbi:hypothetical protein EN779_28880, partial [Mesorhizobium sp. M4B.F.Ca.ET.088.02.2.1]
MQPAAPPEEKLDGGDDFSDAFLRSCNITRREIFARTLSGMAVQESAYQRLRAADCADEVAYVQA